MTFAKGALCKGHLPCPDCFSGFCGSYGRFSPMGGKKYFDNLAPETMENRINGYEFNGGFCHCRIKDVEFEREIRCKRGVKFLAEREGQLYVGSRSLSKFA